MTYSERFESDFQADYDLDKNLKLIPKAPKTIDFNYLKELLLCKDMTRLPELQAIGKDPRFLDGKVDMTGQKISFTSFPRTGNTFLRTFIEQCTGVLTGSDMPLMITATFQFSGVPSEQHCGEDSIWITKTHYPVSKETSNYHVDKIIYIYYL